MAIAEISEFRMHDQVFGATDFPALALVQGGLGSGR